MYRTEFKPVVYHTDAEKDKLPEHTVTNAWISEHDKDSIDGKILLMMKKDSAEKQWWTNKDEKGVPGQSIKQL